MKKIYYNNDGFICELYPYIPVTDNCSEMEISDELYQKITHIPKNHAWKVVNGECLCIDIRTQQEKDTDYLNHLRTVRMRECFAIVNRGQVWYDTLDIYQKEQLASWYLAWLNVTDTKIIPDKPSWLK